MEYFNNQEFYDDDDMFDDDDFEVDFDDDLGYDSGKPSVKKEEKSETKVVKKNTKKEIKVDTKKAKKDEPQPKKKDNKKEEKKEDKKEEKKEEKKVVKKEEPKKTSSSSSEKKKEIKDKKKTKKSSKEEKKEKEEKKKKPLKKKKKKTKKIVIKLPVGGEEGLSKDELEEAIKAALKGEIDEPEDEVREEKEEIEEETISKQSEESEEKYDDEIKEDEEEKESQVETQEEQEEEETEEEQEEEEAEEKEESEKEETEKEEEKIEEESEEEEEEEEKESLFEKFSFRFKRILRRLKPYRKQIFISLGVLTVLLVSFIVIKSLFNVSVTSTINEDIAEKIANEKDEYRNTWDYYEDINSDYVGQIIFDSDMINKPFVQAKSCYKENGVPYKFYNQDGSIVTDFSEMTGNDVYIWMDFETMKYDYDKKGGSIFMDYRNTLADQNLIIYGHYFSTIYNKDPDRVKSFTPLEKLLEEENYKENSRVKLVFQNEIRVYDLFAVYKFDSDNEEFWEKGQYFRPNYNVDDYTGSTDSNYMKTYIDFVNEVKLYDTGVKLEPGDNTLTLQTCMTPYTNLYEICVFKLVDTYIY